MPGMRKRAVSGLHEIIDLKRILSYYCSMHTVNADKRFPEFHIKNLNIGLLFTSPAMRKIYGEIESFARDRQRVLFHGPTGCGKEYLARYYFKHFYKNNNSGSGFLYATNCACLGNMAHSELFGHRKGSFTGADSDKTGLFESAENSVLFLDEIADIDQDIQPKLLRALSPGEAYVLGDKNPYSTKKVTILSATERSLNSIKESLLVRLGHVIEIPPLSEREEDIKIALDQFFADIIKKRGDLKKINWIGDRISYAANYFQQAL
jgi:DNA-binding NtrC family response regulator